MKKMGEISAKLPYAARSHMEETMRKVRTLIVPDSPEFMPEYKNPWDSCCDLKANIQNKSQVIYCGDVVKIDCGIRLEVPSGFEVQIRSRSGLASKGVMVVNGVGTIDSMYKDKVMVLLTCIRSGNYVINHLDRIAQMCIKPVWYFDFQMVDELDREGDRGGGFGSTGK